MPAVDLVPLMNSPLWQSWDEPTRATAKKLFEDPGTSAEDRADMLRRIQGARPAPPTETPVDATPAVAPGTPSPWQALKGAFAGTQRLPFQAGAPAEGTDPLQLVAEAEKEYVPTPVRGVIEGLAGPSSVAEGVATAFVPGPLKPVAGALAAGAGEGIRQWQEGEPFDLTKIGKETMWSALPEVAESGGRAALRTAARGTSTGKTLMREQAAGQARQVPEAVFAPRPAAEIGKSFDAVRATGMKIDMTDIGTHLSTLSPGKQADVLHELTQLDRSNKTGGRFTQLYKDISTGSLAGADIGLLQDFRSQLRRRADALEKYPEAQKLVKDLQDAVDDAIDTSFTAGVTSAQAQSTRDLLYSARQDWARRSAADDMSDMIENKIKSGQDLSTVSFNLAGFYDELRRGRSAISKSVDRAIDMTPGARERFNTSIADVAQRYQYVNLPKVAGMEQVLSFMMLSPTLRDRLHKAIVDGRGTVSPNIMALLANEARREMAPAMTRGQPAREEEGFSLRAPGGVARSAD